MWINSENDILIFFITTFCFLKTDSIQIEQSKFRLVPGKSVELSTSNPNFLTFMSITLDKYSVCMKQCLCTNECRIISISRLNSTCYLFGILALADGQINSTDVDMYLKVSSQLNTNGLINYWPFRSNYSDPVGGADMIPQISVMFTQDRFGESNEALSLDGTGYYEIPNGIYVNGDYTIVTWVRVNQLRKDAKIVDLGGSLGLHDLEFSLSDQLTGRPYVCYNGLARSVQTTSSRVISLGDWHHLAAVLNGNNQSIYMDGVLVATDIFSQIPANIIRTSCQLGRSNFANEFDAYADYDELKFYSRALNYTEILDDITFLPY